MIDPEVLEHVRQWRPFSWPKVWLHCLWRVMLEERHLMCWTKLRLRDDPVISSWTRWTFETKRHYCSCGYNRIEVPT